jgi:hypothetical protein
MKRYLLIAAVISVASARAQTNSGGRLLSAVQLPAPISKYRAALKGFFDMPGHERRILQGTVTYNGNSVPFTFTRELDNNVRLDVGAPGNRSILLVTSIAGSPRVFQSPAGASDQMNHDLLELLASDAPDALLYLFGTSSRTIWMGERYQPAGTTPSYPGPFTDVIASVEVTPYQGGSQERLKRFFFDSSTKLLTSVLYVSAVGATDVEYSGWTTSNGQVCPGTITRSQLGSVQFTATVQSCSSAASAEDGLFSLGLSGQLP